MEEQINAKLKYGQDEALSLVEGVDEIIVAKGKKRLSFSKEEGFDEEELLGVMLGRTGNLRAPTLRMDGKLLVGFNDELYQDFFGE